MKSEMSFAPRTLRAKLDFADVLTLSPTTANVVASHTYRLNSLFDPDYTGAGAQPVGFDELMAMYGDFFVTTTQVHVSGGNRSTVYQGMFLLLPHRGTGPPSTSSEDWLSNPNCMWAFARVAQGGGACEMNLKWHARDWYGLPKKGTSVLTVDEGWGDSSSNPEFPAYVSVGFFPFETQSITADLMVRMSFFAEFRTRKALVQS